MKIGLVSSYAPFVNGGYRFITEWLNSILQENGYKSEIIYIPSTEDPGSLFEQMTAFRLLNLEDRFDRVITFRPPSHLIKHSNKVIWFIHHIRIFYDLWGTSYFPARADDKYMESFRKNLINADTAALNEAKIVYANSKAVAQRLKKYNNVNSEVLYPPVLKPERFFNKSYGDEIISICRIEPHKRQHLLIEAMRFVKSGVKLRICGLGTDENYISRIKSLISLYNLKDKVFFENRWISEDEKIEYLSAALANAYIPFDEDSYGYPVIEAALSKKSTITSSDSGGVSEFVTDGVNGLIVSNSPEDIAGAFDSLFLDKKTAEELGGRSYERLEELGINWQNVLKKILA